MRSSLFVFIGVIDSNSDATIEELSARIKGVFPEYPYQPQIRLKEELLTLTFTKPDFRFYLSFEKKWSENLKYWKKLAQDAELPWDVQPVDLTRLTEIQAQLKQRNWSEFEPYQEASQRIFQEMNKFKNVTTFCIPSIKPSLWRKIFRL